MSQTHDISDADKAITIAVSFHGAARQDTAIGPATEEKPGG
jgi:hypothetical protein